MPEPPCARTQPSSLPLSHRPPSTHGCPHPWSDPSTSWPPRATSSRVTSPRGDRVGQIQARSSPQSPVPLYPVSPGARRGCSERGRADVRIISAGLFVPRYSSSQTLQPHRNKEVASLQGAGFSTKKGPGAELSRSTMLRRHPINGWGRGGDPTTLPARPRGQGEVVWPGGDAHAGFEALKIPRGLFFAPHHEAWDLGPMSRVGLEPPHSPPVPGEVPSNPEALKSRKRQQHFLLARELLRPGGEGRLLFASKRNPKCWGPKGVAPPLKSPAAFIPIKISPGSAPSSEVSSPPPFFFFFFNNKASQISELQLISHLSKIAFCTSLSAVFSISPLSHSQFRQLL